VSTAPETRARLLHHGRLAFAQKGHDRVSLQRDVLEPAKVSTGSFYHQFNDKTDLLVAVLEDAAARGRYMAEHAIEETDDMPPIERMRQRISVWLDLVEAGEDLFRIQVQERNSADERVRRLVVDLRKRTAAPVVERLNENVRLFSDSFDADRAAQLITGLFGAMAIDYLDLPKKQRAKERDQIASAMAQFIVGGVASMAGVFVPSSGTPAS
jgi:AcrR family transcriptional regulator